MEINLFKKMIKKFKPKHKIFVQKIDQEYIILITSSQNQEGLVSLITDKNRLMNYSQHKEIHSKTLTQECELKFKPKE